METIVSFARVQHLLDLQIPHSIEPIHCFTRLFNIVSMPTSIYRYTCVRLKGHPPSNTTPTAIQSVTSSHSVSNNESGVRSMEPVLTYDYIIISHKHLFIVLRTTKLTRISRTSLIWIPLGPK